MIVAFLGLTVFFYSYFSRNLYQEWVVNIAIIFFLHLVRRLSGEGNGTPLQYSCLANPTDGGAWWAAVHGVAKSQTQLSDFTFTFHFHALEEEMATHSSVLAWRITGTGGLPSLWSHRVGHDWSDLAAAVTEPQTTPSKIDRVMKSGQIRDNSRV